MIQYVKTFIKRDGGFVFRISQFQNLVWAEVIGGPDKYAGISMFGIGRAYLKPGDNFDLNTGIRVAIRKAKIGMKAKVAEEISQYKRQEMAIFDQGNFPVHKCGPKEMSRIASLACNAIKNVSKKAETLSPRARLLNLVSLIDSALEDK